MSIKINEKKNLKVKINSNNEGVFTEGVCGNYRSKSAQWRLQRQPESF